ncbi:MAG TPA: hypothetical protein VK943_08080, partial [Arenibaculum sp.]|nr:hypothetical protein [Arenibaculum sp.]
VRGGQLMIRLLSPIPPLFRGFPLQPDDAVDPDIFRIDMSRLGPFSMRVAFGREPGSGVTSASLDVMPISLRKQPAMTNPRRWATGVLGGLGVAVAATVVRRRRSTTRRRGAGGR